MHELNILLTLIPALGSVYDGTGPSRTPSPRELQQDRKCGGHVDHLSWRELLLNFPVRSEPRNLSAEMWTGVGQLRWFKDTS